VKLVEYQHCTLINDFISPNIIAGFTKSSLIGNLPEDVHKGIPFLDQDCGVSYMNQPHSNQVHYVESPGVYDVDGLFTKEERQVLVVKSADCLPIYFFSQKLGTIGIVHMGWRSAAEGILENINQDLKLFKVIFGVGLRRCCYKVGKEFLKYPNFSKYIQCNDEQLYFDPVRFAREELFKRGLSKENLFDLDICSFCSKKSVFSYRRTNASERTLSFILRK